MKVWIGCLADYNAGILVGTVFGDWLQTNYQSRLECLTRSGAEAPDSIAWSGSPPQ